jgi:hypothetical protein
LTSDEIVDNIDKSIPGTAELFDAIAATRDTKDQLPMRCIHFGLSCKSKIGANVLNNKAAHRQCTIVYTGGPLNDVSVHLRGSLTVIEDDRLRRYYWRDRWGSFMKRDDYMLVKFEPISATITSLNGGFDENLIDGVTVVRGTHEWQRV